MDTLACDTSYFQPPLDRSYPHKIWIGRATYGNWPDPDFAQNYAMAKAMCNEGRLAAFGFYTVYLPGQVDSTVSLLRSQIGKSHPRLFLEIDVESWEGQIQGDHSVDINRFDAQLGGLMGSAKRVARYGNRGDLASIHPHPRAGIVTRVASYGSQRVAGYPGQQYTDGSDSWPVPSGLPKASQPFGRCDHNVFWGMTPVQVAALYGVPYVAPKPVAKPVAIAAPEDDMPLFIRFINSPGSHDAVYMVDAGRLQYISGLDYGWLGKPKVRNFDLRSCFWNYPVVPGSADYRKK